MNRSEVDDILWSIKYKPGWELKWARVWGGDLGWLLQFEWTCTRPDREDVTLIEIGHGGVNTIPFSEITDAERLVKLVFAAALRYEEHECREFFMVGDQRPFDPHKRLMT